MIIGGKLPERPLLAASKVSIRTGNRLSNTFTLSHVHININVGLGARVCEVENKIGWLVRHNILMPDNVMHVGKHVLAVEQVFRITYTWATEGVVGD